MSSIAAKNRLSANHPSISTLGSPDPTQPEVETKVSNDYLDTLEAEAIQILREVVAEFENPVLLYSIGKDSSVILHLARKAFYPANPPFPLMHVDSTWEFPELIQFREDFARKELGLEVIVCINEDGRAHGMHPSHPDYTQSMRMGPLKEGIDRHGFDAAIGGGRRDEERSRAKERIFSFRDRNHRWEPRDQRPELWHSYNTWQNKGECMRVFPLSNWTELDVWQYILRENVPLVPLYLAKERPVVERDGNLIVVADERLELQPEEVPVMKMVRFRTLGCYPVTGCVESDADDLKKVVDELISTDQTERNGRAVDREEAASMEKKKREGYF